MLNTVNSFLFHELLQLLNESDRLQGVPGKGYPILNEVAPEIFGTKFFKKAQFRRFWNTEMYNFFV